MTRGAWLSGSFLLTLALGSCDRNPAAPTPPSSQPPPEGGVVVTTDAQQYALTSPPKAAFVTVENRTTGAITVRRCLVQGSAIDPLGVDMVVERAVGATWQTDNLGVDCVTAGWPRADVVLAPNEVALVLRLIAVAPAQFRVRVAYGVGAGAAPTDTATSASFVWR